MAGTLSFDTGLVEYDINGAVKVRFNPTDETFVSGLERLFDALSDLQESATIEEGFKKFADLDKDMRKKIDALLGDGVSDALFPNMNTWAIADGLPVWMNLVMALLDEVSEAYEREFGKTDPRVNAQRTKYDKLMAKYRKDK